jgi:Mg-chelatase subunit ChlD
MKRVRRLLAAGLAMDNSGAVAVFLAAGIVAIVGFAGLATDTARGYMVKARLSQALDAAALAGGKVMFQPGRDDDIRMFFEANFPAGFMDASVAGPSIVPDADGERIRVSASAVIPTTFLRVLGIETVRVSSETEVTRQMQMLDVVLAIDMSGSMTSSAGGGQTRIQAARTAAVELVEILFGADANKDLLKIGVVPWNAKVRVMLNGVAYDADGTTPQTVPSFTNPLTGASQSQVFYANNTPVPLLSAPPQNWRGCVYSRYLDNGIDTDDADDRYAEYTGVSGDWMAWEPVGPEGEPVSGGTCSLAVWGSECTPCLNRGITPLTKTKQAVLDAVNELTSPNGNTNIPQGLGWAWRVLMPQPPFTEAELNPEGERQQAIVLLTDGENYGGSGDGYKGVWGIGSAARDEMNDRLRALAAAIKASGVIIYTIQFANSGGPLQALMREVATGPDSPYYHYAPDGDALRAVFREVANNLSELRLSK